MTSGSTTAATITSLSQRSADPARRRAIAVERFIGRGTTGFAHYGGGGKAGLPAHAWFVCSLRPTRRRKARLLPAPGLRRKLARPARRAGKQHREQNDELRCPIRILPHNAPKPAHIIDEDMQQT